jgi:hypothetical protein
VHSQDRVAQVGAVNGRETRCRALADRQPAAPQRLNAPLIPRQRIAPLATFDEHATRCHARLDVATALRFSQERPRGAEVAYGSQMLES